MLKAWYKKAVIHAFTKLGVLKVSNTQEYKIHKWFYQKEDVKDFKFYNYGHLTPRNKNLYQVLGKPSITTLKTIQFKNTKNTKKHYMKGSLKPQPLQPHKTNK